MFCGCLSSNHEQQNELIIRGPFASQLDHIVNRQNRNQIMEAMTNLVTYNFVIPSDYQREYKNCKLNNSQFVDKNFLPNASSLNYAINGRRIVWKRITEIIPKAQIVERQIEPSDIQQGNIGDCYFLACLAAIAENAERIRRIFCDEMQIKNEGIYRLQLACQGKYTEIVIDDFVPVFEGSNRPVFCKPSGNQVWVMLLEKAWAKLSGSYGNISAGYPHQILNTFSVAPCFYYDIPNILVKQEQQKQELWIKILEATKLKLPMCAGSRQNHTCKGIKSAHTYTVLGAYQINSSSRGSVQLLKLRNPWGDTEYVGKFSELDTSFWQSVDLTTKLVIFGNGHSNDGIFTIEYNEFIRNFECIDISHDLPNYNYTFETVTVKNYESNYFQLDIIEDGKENDDFYITMQKDFNRNQFIKNRQTKYGYSRLVVAKIQLGQQGGTSISYQYVNSLLETNFPDSTIKCKALKRGKYIIMAQTEHPNKSEGDLTLSVYCKAKMNVRKVANKHQLFLQRVFSSHANSRQFVQKRFMMNQNPNSWTLSMFLFKEGGYGYICSNVAYNSKEKVKVTCNLQKIYAEGFYLIDGDKKINQGIFEFIIEPGRCELILLGIDLKRDFRELSFPPKGIKMQRII